MSQCIICGKPEVIKKKFFVVENSETIQGNKKVHSQRVCGIVEPSLCADCVQKFLSEKANAKQISKLQKKGETEQIENLLLVYALEMLIDTSIPGKKPSVWWEVNQGSQYIIPRFIPEHCVVYNAEGSGPIYYRLAGGGSTFYFLRKNNAKGTFIKATGNDSDGVFSSSNILLLESVSADLVRLANM